jgi:hypothetical protein
MSLLHLETARGTTTTSAFEFTSFTAHVRFDTIVGVGIVDGDGMTKMGQSRTTFGTPQQDRIGSLGSTECQFVERNAFSTGGDNALTGVFRKAQGTNTHFGTIEHPNIVRDLADNNGCLVGLGRHVLGESVESNWWCVDLAHVQSLQNGFTEFRIGTTTQKLVQFDQETIVRISRFDLFHTALVAATAAAGFEIDPHAGLLALLSSICLVICFVELIVLQ